MATSLGKVFGITLNQSAAKAAVASVGAATVGRATSQVLIGWIPGLGNIINASTAASITETIGWIMATEFEKEKNIQIRECKNRGRYTATHSFNHSKEE